MAKTPLRFATGASTPLYLPLSVFQRHQGFNLNLDYAIEVFCPAKGNENGDVAAAQQLVTSGAEFALCDPVVAEATGDVRVVATIVGRMAFWAVAKRNIGYFDDFKEFATIFTYPEGMTGHYVGRLIRRRLGNQHKVVPVPIDTEFEALVNEPCPAVALTANLLLARRFVNQHPGYEISSVWKLDPSFSSVMLTGLLAGVEVVETDHTLVRSVVSGLNRAVALLTIDNEEGVQALHDSHQITDKPEADFFVNEIRRNQIYPTVLTPELTSWHNLREVHKQGSERRSASTPIKSTQSSSRTFSDRVTTRPAREAEELTLRVLARFGKGELYVDVAKSIEHMDRISLDDLTIVGAYKRWNDIHREALKRWVERIRTGIVTRSNTDENFLIWGTSGSGKTFLIEQLGDALTTSGLCEFRNVNLAKSSADQVRKAMREIEATTGPVLCLLDEIDATAELTMDYTFLFNTLRWRRLSGKQIVFVLAGSGMRSVAELAAKIGAPERERGADLVGFIPKDQRFEIPDYAMWDRLVIFIGSAVRTKANIGTPLRALQKLALYYVAVDAASADARGLSRLGESAALRMADQDKMSYEHLFDRVTGIDSQYSFIAEHYDIAQSLIGRFLEVV